MSNPLPGSPEWLDLTKEEIIDPERPIIDPHHHLWRRAGGNNYLLENLRKDTGSGHNIVKTVFVECHAEYRSTGPEHLKSLGETEFVVKQAEESETGGGNAKIAAIVAHADLRNTDVLPEVLDAHTDIGAGKFRGIRHAGARDPHPEALMIAGRAPEGLYDRDDFRQGVKMLGAKGLTYDTWHYHHQNAAFAALAKACPDTQMVLDHFGTPLGVGAYATQREEIFSRWKRDIEEIARCDNVVAKIGGLAMPDNGFGWHTQDRPPGSDEFAQAQRRYYLHTIDCFGPARCMMESNFPVDKFSISYAVLYNGLKKIVADFSDAEKDQMFFGTASRIYSIV